MDEPKKEKPGPRYDAVLKDLFQHDHPSLADLLTGGVAVKASLNVEFAIVEERRAGLVWLLEDGSILHVDFQSDNHGEMAYREGIYGLMIGQTHKCRVRQVVLYTGRAKMRMPNSVDLGEIQVRFTLMDIRELNAETLIKSGKPGDLVLALLASGGASRMVQILRRAKRLPGPQRERVLTQLAVYRGCAADRAVDNGDETHGHDDRHRQACIPSRDPR